MMQKGHKKAVWITWKYAAGDEAGEGFKEGYLAAGGTLDGTEYPRLIELTVHQALALAGDPRAAEWLARAHTALMAQADAISQHSTDPALRHGFLNHIPHNRAIVAAWAGRISAW